MGERDEGRSKARERETFIAIVGRLYSEVALQKREAEGERERDVYY